jgi:hypothetical protein
MRRHWWEPRVLDSLPIRARARPRASSRRSPPGSMPSTKGEAEDIGVGSLLRSSAAQISEAELAKFGLYRPFDPSDDPNNPEVNHIQLIPSGGSIPLPQASATRNPDPRCR